MKNDSFAAVLTRSSPTVIAVLLSATAWGAEAHPKNSRPRNLCQTETQQLCQSVLRKHHHFRHWSWSGLPFEEGSGFIPDPHILCSDDTAFSEPVSGVLSDRDSRYAIADVNPFFNDNSSEILLLMKSHGEVLEYSLNFPKRKDVRTILACPLAAPAMVFAFRNGFVVLANFYGRVKGAYLLPFPLRRSATLDFVRFGTVEFADIVAAFRSVAQDRSTKDQFCEATNDFRAFYEEYSGSCGVQPRTASEIESEFARFWRQDQ